MIHATKEITLSNIGPVHHLSIPIPAGGGIVVLRGRNDIGKSETLNAIESALTGRGTIQVKDGQQKGEISGLGVTIKIGRSARRSGELECEILDGKFSVADLVDPGIKSPEAADAKRIKTLVSLSGVEPSPEMFYGLVGSKEDFESIVGKLALDSKDTVVMAERVKRDLEQAARKAEGAASTAETKAKTLTENIKGIDLLQECDSAVLQQQLTDAVSEEARLSQQAKSASEARTKSEEAQRDIVRTTTEYKGPKYQEAVDADAESQKRLLDAEKALEIARQAFTAAQSAVHKAQSDRELTQERMMAAATFETTVKKWQDQLSADIPSPPSIEQQELAGQKVTTARQALEQGALIRRAIDSHAEAHIHAQEYARQQLLADQLREAAKATDDILSDCIAKLGLVMRVEAGRLVLDTDRGVTYFGDLSDGKRWRMAIDLAIDSVGFDGFIIIKQPAYEGLQPKIRREIAEHAKERGVVILTASASDDEQIHAELFAE